MCKKELFLQYKDVLRKMGDGSERDRFSHGKETVNSLQTYDETKQTVGTKYLLLREKFMNKFPGWTVKPKYNFITDDLS